LEAIELIREALEKTQPDFHYLIPICYYQYTRIYWELGDLETAKKYCDLAIAQLDLYPEHFYTNIVGWKLYNLRGIISNALSEDIFQILNYFTYAKTLSLNHHFIEALPDIYLNISSTFLNFGNYKSAKYYLENCILASEEVENFKILSLAYENLAEIFGLQGNYRDAHSYFEKAIALRLSLGLSMWSIYNKLAILERSYGHFKEASMNHEEALRNINQYQENRQKALILSQYSITLLRMNKIELALELINSAQKTLKSQKRNLLPELFLAEGMYFLIKDGPNSALEHFFKAYSLAQEYSQPINIVESSLYVIKCLVS
jgi:tetratricopeptide (TPR) repeat protein